MEHPAILIPQKLGGAPHIEGSQRHITKGKGRH